MVAATKGIKKRESRGWQRVCFRSNYESFRDTGRAASVAVSEDALPAARLLSQPWNCIFPFHSDTCWEQLSGDSPAALLGKGLSSAKWRVYGNQADWFPSFPYRLSQALIRGKTDVCSMINAQKHPTWAAPETRHRSISCRPSGERSEEHQRAVFMQEAKFSPCSKEVKARVNSSPLQELKGHMKGKVMFHLLFADSLSVNIGQCRKKRSWASTFGLIRYGHCDGSPNCGFSVLSILLSSWGFHCSCPAFRFCHAWHVGCNACMQ